jgi:peptide deformylase
LHAGPFFIFSYLGSGEVPQSMGVFSPPSALFPSLTLHIPLTSPAPPAAPWRAAIAAPQIDKMYKIIIVRSDLDDKTNQDFTALINPEVVKFEGNIVEDFEGCLSITGIYGKVPRHEKVRVKALDVHGNEVRIKADGFLGRVLQHEIDHTNGIVFIDHIKDQKNAFYTLDDNGELQPLDYDKDIKNNHDLWED